MKYRIIFFTFLSLVSCNHPTKSPVESITSKESQLLDQINFDTALMLELKQQTQSDFIQLPSIDAETGQIMDSPYEGLFSNCDEDKTTAIVNSLKEKFRKSGYLLFTTDDKNYKMGIAVLKGTNDLEILEYRKTDGINYDLESSDVFNKISNWKKDYGLTIIGCSASWVEVHFKKLPKELDSFAKEVYDFCPDSIDQGLESLEELEAYIKETQSLWLWWD